MVFQTQRGNVQLTANYWKAPLKGKKLNFNKILVLKHGHLVFSDTAELTLSGFSVPNVTTSVCEELLQFTLLPKKLRKLTV